MGGTASIEKGLYVVATPIGNLKDMTARAIEVLQGVDLIAAEDTRHSNHLLKTFGINTRLISFHDFSSSERLQKLVDKLIHGKSIALISDAGTPAISDPGYELVRLARQQNVLVMPVPGASAMLAALSVSGLPSDSFLFEGCLPAKSGVRKNRLQTLQSETRSMVFFETPHRIIAFLEDVISVFGGEREIYFGRELTKIFETSRLDTVFKCLEWVKGDSHQQKGEFVLVIAGLPKAERVELKLVEGLRILKILLPEISTNKAAKLAALISGAPKNKLYDTAIKHRR